MPNTPFRNYPYPALTDAPAGHSQIQSLASSLDTDIQTQVNRISNVETFALGKAARVVSGNAQALSPNTNTVMLYTTIEYNHNSAMNYSSGVLTLNATGIWVISGTIQTSVSGGAAYVWLGHGSLTTPAHRYALSVEPTAGISAHCLYTERKFTAGDTVALWFWGQSGTVQTLVTETETAIAARYIGNPV